MNISNNLNFQNYSIIHTIVYLAITHVQVQHMQCFVLYYLNMDLMFCSFVARTQAKLGETLWNFIVLIQYSVI